MGNELRDSIAKLATTMTTVASTDLPISVVESIKGAYKRETVTAAKEQLSTILKNIELSKDKTSSLCQDIGIPTFKISVGSEARLDFDIEDMLTKATAEATAEVPLRQNICHPLTKLNTKTNTGFGIPVFYYDYLYGKDYIEIESQFRGGGSAFRSSVYSLAPTAPRLESIKKVVFDHVAMAGGIPCPPTVVGIGLGGTPDQSLNLAFDALYRDPVGSPHPEEDMAEIESVLYKTLNETGIGTMGLGGDTTVLAVHLEYIGSHIATHPVAIAFGCWVNRYAKVRFYKDGRVEWLTHNK